MSAGVPSSRARAVCAVPSAPVIGAGLATRSARAVALLAVAGLAACGDGGVGPPTTARPAEVVKLSGDLQAGPVTEPLPIRLEVEVQDSAGDPIPGTTVTWSPCGRGGEVMAVDSVTDGAGRAAATWVLGTSTGLRSVTVRAGERQAVFNAVALPGPAARLDIVAGDGQAGSAGSRLTDRLRFRALDAHDNPVASAGVHWRVAAGDGRLEDGETVTDHAGVAGTYWVLGEGADQRLEARVGDAVVVFSATLIGS